MKTRIPGIVLIGIGVFLIAFAELNYKAISNSGDSKNSPLTVNYESPLMWPEVIGFVLLIGGMVSINPRKKLRE